MRCSTAQVLPRRGQRGALLRIRLPAHSLRRRRYRPALRVHHPARRGRRPARSSPRPATRPSPPARRVCRGSRRRSEARRLLHAPSGARRTAKLYAAKQALFVHAVASPYRDRSHFDGQNVLETGGIGRLPAEGRLDEPAARPAAAGRSQGARLVTDRADGAARRREVSSYAPSECRARPTTCSPAWRSSMRATAAARAVERCDGDADGRRCDAGRRRAEWRGDRRARGQIAGRRRRADRDDRDQWLGHASGQRGRLAAQLRGLDQLVAALKTGLGADWANTLVLVAPSSAAPSPQRHRRHRPRHASAAMLLGGAVAGGKVSPIGRGLRSRTLRRPRPQPTRISTR